MILLADKWRKWRVSISIGEETNEVILYDTSRASLIFSSRFLSSLKMLIAKYPHYMSGEIIKKLLSPEDEDYSGFSVFMVMCIFKKRVAVRVGKIHYFLFAILREGGVELIGVSDEKITDKTFLEAIGIIIDSPDNVQSLIMAL
jgi:hypothetical protein